MRPGVGKILIVDDEAAVWTTLEVLFDVRGLCTLTAADPVRAGRDRCAGCC